MRTSITYLVIVVEQDVVQLEGEVDDQTGDVEEGALVHVSDSAARDQSVGVCNTRAHGSLKLSSYL